MNTQFVGLKEFRENMSKYSNKNTKYIILKRNVPLFEVKVLDPKQDIYKEDFLKGLQEGLDDIKNGRVYTQEEVMKEFGLI
jgi:hypothetical protein